MKYEKKIKKISGISAFISLVVSVIFELLRQYIPGITARPTAADLLLSVFRNIFLVILALTFTAFLFLVLKKRLGTIKAVFYTIYSDSLIGFVIGAVIMSIASMRNVAAVGITALESIYYYFLGIFIMLISAAVFIIGMITFAVLRFILSLKAKRHQDLK